MTALYDPTSHPPATFWIATPLLPKTINCRYPFYNQFSYLFNGYWFRKLYSELFYSFLLLSPFMPNISSDTHCSFLSIVSLHNLIYMLFILRSKRICPYLRQIILHPLLCFCFQLAFSIIDWDSIVHSQDFHDLLSFLFVFSLDYFYFTNSLFSCVKKGFYWNNID